jgi:hypothetical protein
MLNSKLEPKVIKGSHRRLILILAVIVIVMMIIFGRGGFGSEALLINEVVSSNRFTISDEDGEFPDWIELFNSGNAKMDLEGFWISNDPANPLKWEFPQVSLDPGEYLVIFASGKDRAPKQGHLHTNFRLSAEGCAVILSAPDGKMIDSVKVGALYTNISYGRRPGRLGDWVLFYEATPADRNSDQWTRSIEIGIADPVDVHFNEVMTSNKTSIYDTDGDLSDWIEFFHSGDEPFNLKGYWLSDDPLNPFKWRFPDITVEPGEYLIVYASGKSRSTPNKNNLHASFSLNDTDDVLVLSNPTGKAVEKLVVRSMIQDVSYGLVPDNRQKWLYYPVPTPRGANTTQGYEAGELSGKELKSSYKVQINEVMAMNTNTHADENGAYVDWIELYNYGETAINLKGFGLSDREGSPFRWVFPDVTLQPNSHLVVFASGKDRRTPGRNLHTNFGISSRGEYIYLTSPDSGRVDTLASGMQSAGISAGRYPDGENNRFFFTNPTPGRANPSGAYTGYAQPPLVSHLGGRYDDRVQVTLINPNSQGVIRYTTNGKVPDANSTIYNGPINISKTTIIRARVFEQGKLPSSSVDQTYLVNETTDFAVMSVFMEPKDLWDPATGIYVMGYGASSEFPYVGANFWKKWERPIHFQLIEPDGTLGFSYDAGIRVGGAYSRAMGQKVLNIFARNRYGSATMEYPFFPTKTLTTYKALTLRQSGQDAVLSYMRDTMQTSLLDVTDLDYQAYRPIVLYLNGEYWGLYYIRERINEYYLAYNHDADPTKIDLLQANRTVRAGSNTEYTKLRDFVSNNDMRVAKNYEYVKTQMDVQNYMDYWIAEIYFANTDSANIRFWKERDNPKSKWCWIVYDTDWGFFNVNHNTLAHVTSPEGTGVGRHLSTVIMVNLLKNTEFRTEFINRLAYHLNTTFTPERVVARIDEMEKVIEKEMPRQIERWGGKMSAWRSQVQRLRNFALKRNTIMMGHIQQKFGLSNKEMEIFDDWNRR